MSKLDINGKNSSGNTRKKRERIRGDCGKRTKIIVKTIWDDTIMSKRRDIKW